MPRACVEDGTRTLPCRFPPILMHRARLRVGNTAVYLHSRSKTVNGGGCRWEYQDNYVKCNAGYQKRKGENAKA